MPTPKLFGIADTHVHFIAHLAHAGYGIWGKPHPNDPATRGEDALKECLPHCDGPGGHGPGAVLPSLEGVGFTHFVGGFPEFDGWPQHATMAHQQAFIDWIRRAYDGGLRLAVCLAVNSELLATRMTELYGPNLAIDDMSAITRQIDAMRAMVDFVDQQEGGAGNGWMQIALTPADARRIVKANKLCIVMGVEVAALGGWKTPEQLEKEAHDAGKQPRELIAAMVNDLYDRGVRHFFPLHGTNNAFGGAALFVRNYDAANYLSTGKSFDVEQAPEELGISYRINEDEFTGGAVAEVLGYHGLKAAEEVAGYSLLGTAIGGFIFGLYGAAIGGAVGGGVAAGFRFTPPNNNWKTVPEGGHINAMGLTSYGEMLIEELGKHGALIDIDHMGEHTTDSVLTLCEGHRYPVVSGHSSFRELKYSNTARTFRRDASLDELAEFGTKNGRNLASEVNKSPQQLARIRELGGYVSPMLAQHDGRDCGCGARTVANISAGSSQAFARAYLYAHHHMNGERVGLASDINGGAQLPGPRFGPQGSADIREDDDRVVRAYLGVTRREQVIQQTNGVRYSTPPKEYRYCRFADEAISLPGAPFDQEERDFWEAIVIWKAGIEPANAEWTPWGILDGGRQARIVNFALGLRANSRGELLPFGKLPQVIFPAPILPNLDQQIAAFTVSRHGGAERNDLPELKRLIAKLGNILNHWEKMEHRHTLQGGVSWMQERFGPNGSGIYEADGSLRRSQAGHAPTRERDFDINMDGMAHYGMLPDFLQDLWNIGMPEDAMQTLYHSAEDYISVWERCEQLKFAWSGGDFSWLFELMGED